MITKERIKTLALETGFHACGITLPKPIPQAEEALRSWSSQGKHGEMKYLENYDGRKNRFWGNFGNAKSIIVLGVNYFSKQSPSVCHEIASPRQGEARNDDCLAGR